MHVLSYSIVHAFGHSANPGAMGAVPEILPAEILPVSLAELLCMGLNDTKGIFTCMSTDMPDHLVSHSVMHCSHTEQGQCCGTPWQHMELMSVGWNTSDRTETRTCCQQHGC